MSRDRIVQTNRNLLPGRIDSGDIDVFLTGIFLLRRQYAIDDTVRHPGWRARCYPCRGRGAQRLQQGIEFLIDQIGLVPRIQS